MPCVEPLYTVTPKASCGGDPSPRLPPPGAAVFLRVTGKPCRRTLTCRCPASKKPETKQQHCTLHKPGLAKVLKPKHVSGPACVLCTRPDAEGPWEDAHDSPCEGPHGGWTTFPVTKSYPSWHHQPHHPAPVACSP